MPDGQLTTINPATLEVLGTVPEHGEAEVRQAVQRARAAFRAWSTRSFAERREDMLAVRDHLLDRADDVVNAITAETGKTRFDALMIEVLVTADLIGHYARHGERILRPERVSAGTFAPLKRGRIEYEPLGVVAVISPWNYPFALTMTPVVTALFAGNTVVLKPSEVTPLVGVLVGELFANGASQPDLVQVVTGGGATGNHLVRAGVQKVCFTGSVATGKKVMAAASETLTPVLLELGGKDPMIVLDDADVERAARGAVWGAFANSGQTCIAVERVYVHERIYDTFVSKVVERTKQLRQGHDREGDAVDVGSMTFPPQVDTVERHLADAVAKGARVLTGGARRDDLGGLFFEPTVIVDVDHSMELMREETFGPVLPIVKVADEQEALRLANDSPYGLNSSVWTATPERARRVADALDAGSVCVNDCLVNYGVASLPFGGVKDSGIGRAHGAAGLREMSRTKAVLEDRFSMRREVQWYPVPRWGHAAARRALKVLYRRGLRNKLRGLLRG
jgi:acyl-CoA reductase-like NAD-dependent aldehyde dehydrogenase